MKKLEADIKQYLEERAWDKLRPGDLAKSISIEAGELLELFQWANPTHEEVLKDKKKLEEIKNELADVLTYCFDITVSLGLDTEAIIREKLEHVKKKYPAHVMSKMKGKEPGTEPAYWDIKKKYRKNA